MLQCTNIQQGRPNFGQSAHWCRFPGQIRALLSGVALASGLAGAAAGQTVPPVPSQDLSTPPATTLIDPQAEKQADRIKDHTWRSAPVGQQKNWNLDIGHFKEDKAQEQDLRERISEDEEAYSGFRLRLPLKGGR